MLSITDILGSQGPLTKKIEGFAPRAQQQEMADAVAEAIDEDRVLIAEAGTGTGKTLAYLVPAVLSGKKVVVSTGTRNLQDQLFHRDLPLLCESLSLSLDAALLKGRANYLCKFRLEHQMAEGRLGSREQVDQLAKIHAWSTVCKQGDIAEFSEIPEDANIWPLVTSNADNCLGQECPDLSECHLAKARKRAQAADLVVVNHHLLMADMALKEEGFGELLPGSSIFIIDEAHQLPDVATNFFGISISARQISDLARDALLEQHRDAPDASEIAEIGQSIETAVKKVRLALGVESRRAAWDEISGNNDLEISMGLLESCLAKLSANLELVAPGSKGLESCWRRCNEMIDRLAMISGPSPESYVRWFETYPKSFVLYLTPLQISEQFQAQINRYEASWIFTSATLAVGDSFEHFQSRLGLEGVVAKKWDSPFNYPLQAVLYVPPELPEPSSREYTKAVVEASIDVLKAGKGRAFMLFTSYRALGQAQELLQDRLEFPILVQGSAPKTELLKRFVDEGNAVLLGTNSFWEGVDVRGPALSTVIIDKLPFASPGDPVMQAKISALRDSGQNPFIDFQLPSAVISLKQGVGRLIRDVNDYGVLVLCDPRLLSKGYGKVFLESLPAMSKTRKIEVVERFFDMDRVDLEAAL